MKTIFIFTNIASHYRSLLWRILLTNPDFDIHFFFGKNKTIGIREIDFDNEDFVNLKHKLHHVKNYWIKGKVLIWQKGVLRQCLTPKIDTVIFLGEMYCISTWFATIICRFRGVNVVYWGHGFYGNEGKIKMNFRKAFYRLADGHLLYDSRAKNLMINNGFNPNKLFVVFNSLDYEKHKMLRNKFQSLRKEEVFPFFHDTFLPVLIFIGRLTYIKRLDSLLRAALEINKKKTQVNLIIIGDGPVKTELLKQGEKGLKDSWLYFADACYNEEEIGKYLYTADLCVSPGNVGLTAMHSLSFGTPVGTHNNLSNQMPEANAITDGYNGFFFEEDNVEDLVEKIKNWLASNTDRDKIREYCYEVIDKFYNPSYQLSVFQRLLNDQNPQI